MDPHVVLGIDLFASENKVIRAFRRLALLHHPDRNGGSTASAARFREVKAAYDALRTSARPRAPEPEREAPPRTEHDGRHARELERDHVERVRTRLNRLIETVRTAIAAPSTATLAAVIDDARWTRLDVDTSLALKGHVADLRDAAWRDRSFTTESGALATLEEFAAAPSGKLSLIEMRNLRARLDGLLAVVRGYHASRAK